MPRRLARNAPLILAVMVLSLCAGCKQRVPIAGPVPPLRSEPIPAVGILPSHEFGQLFCAVLDHVSTPTTAWGFCGRYFSPSGTPTVITPDFEVDGFRLLVVPGIFGECVEALARPFEDARRHLWSAHKIEVEYVSVTALGSAEHNAELIDRYLETQTSTDKRPYIAFGYSKGASDLIEAVSTLPTARRFIRAIVTVAGSVLGSRLTEGVPRHLLDVVAGEKLGTCSIGDGGGIDDLRRASRVEALSTFVPPSGFHAYSIAAISDVATTSAVLMNGWKQLTAYSQEQDSQVIHEDAIVPGGVYLGIAKGDHWAVALPFEDVPKSHALHKVIQRLVNHNHYPRVALFEAATRYVVADLRRSK